MMHNEPLRQDIYDYIKSHTVYNSGVQFDELKAVFGMCRQQIRDAIIRFPPNLLVWESDDGDEVGALLLD